ncbi:MAG TPA: acetylxylan esterase [Myxococcota bacterium]|nr:acetylxylan esterase [Myxococcota bacterium]
MTDELHLARYPEPLGLWVRKGARIAAHPELRTQEIEFSSRGDRVTGQLILPAEGGGPYPLVLVQHALGDSAAGVLGSVGTGWVEAGAAVAAVDFPLHGARADQKLLGMLTDGRSAGPHRAAITAEFTQQAVIDLERALDALAAATWIDAERIAYVGFGLGGQLGGAFCALDPRPATAALAARVGGALEAGPDPARYLARIAPRPVLRVEEPPAASAPAIWNFLAQTLAPPRAL